MEVLLFLIKKDKYWYFSCILIIDFYEFDIEKITCH